MKACIVPAREAGGVLEVAGLAVAERTRRSLVRAGFTLVAPGDAGDDPVLLVAGDAAVDPDTARALGEATTAGAGAVVEDDPLEAPAAIALPAGTGLGAAIEEAADLAGVAVELRARHLLRVVTAADAVCERVGSPDAARRLEKRMLDAMVRPSDGFFARHFDRRLSSRLSPFFVRSGISPNAITVAATLVGLGAAALLATQAHGLHVLGALLFIGSTVLDGCDGEVARLSFTSSEFGRRLDLAGDNVVNAAVFLAIGWGALRAEDGGVSTTLVLVTLAGFALATVSGYTFARWVDRTGRSGDFSALYERLASRDFAYFVLLLALLDRLHGFVWFAAIGSYTFVAILAAIRIRAGRGPRPPAAPAGEEQWA